MGWQYGDTALTLTLTLTLTFTGALHTYLRCDDVAAVRVQGLQGLRYEDSTKGSAVATQEEKHLALEGEVDRVYLGTPAEAYVIDGARATRVLKMGLPDAVVWNIGEAKLRYP